MGLISASMECRTLFYEYQMSQAYNTTWFLFSHNNPNPSDETVHVRSILYATGVSKTLSNLFQAFI